MIVQTLPITRPQTLRPVPLTPASFSPFGSVINNPHPSTHPTSLKTEDDARNLTAGAVSANQGTAIQYRAIAPGVPLDLYSDPDHLAREEKENAGATSLTSSSGKRQPASPKMTMFVCASRAPVPSSSSQSEISVPIPILERHPFTTQTFIPLGVSASSQQTPPGRAYLVIVAPTLPPGVLDEGLPVPGPVDTPGLPGFKKKEVSKSKLPGRGLPDLDNLHAFVAHGNQAVTYGPGTWHAPMIALGPKETAMEFAVLQYGNGVGIEECQEVVLESKEEEKQIAVKVTARDFERSGEKSKL